MVTDAQRDRIERYLAAVDAAMGATPADERIEVVAGVREHIDSALADLHEPTDADLDAVLRQLGDPLMIATAAGGPVPAPVPRARVLAAAWVPTAVVLLIGAGAVSFFLVLPLLLWLAGIVLLWASSLWRVAEKVWGTLVPFATVIIVVAMSGISPPGSVQACTASSDRPEPVCVGGPSPAVTVIAWIVLAAIVLAIGWALFVLWRRGMRRVATPDPPSPPRPAVATQHQDHV